MKRGLLLPPIIAFIGFICFLRLRLLQGAKPDKRSQSEKKVQTIKVAMWDYEFHEYDKKLIEAFNRQYPHIKVEVISSPNVFYANKINAMLAGSEEIDVIYTPTVDVYNDLQVNHFIIPLDDLIERDKVDMGRFRDSLKIDNQTYGIPYRNDWYVLYYNKDLFDKNNIPYPTNNMTWEEYRQMGKRLTSGNGIHKIYGISTNMAAYGHVLPRSEGNKQFDYVRGDFEALRRGLELIINIQFKDQSAVNYATNKSINSEQRVFEKGQTGMMINGTWFINYLVNDKKNGLYHFEWGIVKMPNWGEELKTAKYLSPICINIKTTKLEAAWTFVKFVAGKDGAEILASEGMLPAFENEEIHKLYVQSSGLKNGDLEAIREENFSIVQPSADSDVLSIRNMVYQEVEKVMTKEKSIDEALADMKERRGKFLENKQ